MRTRKTYWLIFDSPDDSSPVVRMGKQHALETLDVRFKLHPKAYMVEVQETSSHFKYETRLIAVSDPEQVI